METGLIRYYDPRAEGEAGLSWYGQKRGMPAEIIP